MKSRSMREALAYLMQIEDSSSQEQEGWERTVTANAPGRELLDLVKSGLWTVIALGCAYGLSRLSDAHSLF